VYDSMRWQKYIRVYGRWQDEAAAQRWASPAPLAGVCSATDGGTRRTP